MRTTDGNGSFGPQQVITTAADWAASVYAADLDGDGDLDVLSASSGTTRSPGTKTPTTKGTFGPQQLIAARTEHGIPPGQAAGDLDGDGDLDVLAAILA